MLGGELLIALAEGKTLRGLNESARTFGLFLEVHRMSLSRLGARPPGIPARSPLPLSRGNPATSAP
jgi:hypothetical protein